MVFNLDVFWGFYYIMRIILHIGNYKTGTTALQNFLFINSKKLAEKGIYYGNTWKIVNNHAGLAFAILKEALEKYGLSSLCDELTTMEERPEKTVARIRFMAQERGAETVIISHEGLFADLLQVSAGLSCSLSEGDTDRVNWYICTRLKELFPEAGIVCYLRRQDLYAESMYMEYCKVPWKPWETPVSFSVFMDRQHLCLDYNKEISRWKKIYCNNFYYKAYEKENLLNKNIIYDFLCGYAGLMPDDIKELQMPGTDDINISLSRDALAHKLINKVNHPVLNYLYKVYSQEYPDNTGREKYGFMSAGYRQKFLGRYNGGNKMLFGGNGFNNDILPYSREYPGLTDAQYEKISRWINEILE